MCPPHSEDSWDNDMSSHTANENLPALDLSKWRKVALILLVVGGVLTLLGAFIGAGAGFYYMYRHLVIEPRERGTGRGEQDGAPAEPLAAVGAELVGRHLPVAVVVHRALGAGPGGHHSVRGGRGVGLARARPLHASGQLRSGLGLDAGERAVAVAVAEVEGFSEDLVLPRSEGLAVHADPQARADGRELMQQLRGA